MAKQSEIENFKSVLKPLVDHKNAYQEYKGTTTEGGIPRTPEQEKIEAGQKWQKKYMVDPLTAVPSALWNIPFGNTKLRAGKQNWIIQSKADVAQRKDELENFRLYREKRDRVRDQILEMADAGKKKYIATGDKKYLDLVSQTALDMMSNENLKFDDFTTVDPEVLALRDGTGLFSNQPNPYPVLEGYAKFGLGTYGMIKGDKLVVKNFLKGAKTGFKHSKGNWLKRTAGTVLGGAAAVAVADYGYESMLDIMSRSGQAKKWMADDMTRAGIMDAALAEVMPEAWTFGPEGINRPEQAQRIESAISAFKWDAAITSAFFGARPLYYGLRQVVGAVPFRMFKGKPSKAPGIVSADELLASEQRLLERWAPKEGAFKGPKEKLVFSDPLGIPKLGTFLWRLSNSKAFSWLGGPGPIKKGSNQWWPDPVEIQGTMLGKHMVGGQLAPGLAATLAPAPLFGGGIRNNMATQGDFYIQGVFEKMLGAFAPYAGTKDMAVNWTKLGSANARGFIAHAKDLDKKFTDAAEGMGKGFSDENLVSVGKQTLREYRRKLQTDPAGEVIPQEIRNKVIKFIEGQVLKPVGEGRKSTMRDIHQMKGLREQMDDLLKPIKDDVLENTTYADDITRLFTAWETDIGSVSKMGYPEVSKAFEAYDNFVSKGMLLWGTDVGQAIGKVNKRGFNINLDMSSTRAGQSLFEVVVNSAKKYPASSASELAAIRRIVGDRGYHNGIGTYIKNAFHKSINEVDGIMRFDGTAFRSALGIGEEGSALKALMNEALPGPKVAKLKIFDPKTGIWKEFDDELYATGVKKGLKDILGEEIPEGLLKAETRQLPTIKEFEELTTILEKLFKDGIPRPAKFMMRRAIMGGVRSALKAVIPTTALGAGTAAGVISVGALPMAGLAWLLNYGGKVLTNPVSMKVFRNMLDTSIEPTIRIANFHRLVRMYPEEWMEFDKDLAEMEREQRIYDQSEQMRQKSGTTGERIKDTIIENMPSLEDLKSIPGNIIDSPFNTPNLLEQYRKREAAPGGPDAVAPEAPYAEDTGAYDTSRVGSSITNNPTMNPAAAGALYAGNTDAALAAQYSGGTQYAAGGGLMEMNPVMNNQGKYTDIQTGINDNPFQNSKNKGIMGVL